MTWDPANACIAAIPVFIDGRWQPLQGKRAAEPTSVLAPAPGAHSLTVSMREAVHTMAELNERQATCMHCKSQIVMCVPVQRMWPLRTSSNNHLPGSCTDLNAWSLPTWVSLVNASSRTGCLAAALGSYAPYASQVRGRAILVADKLLQRLVCLTRNSEGFDQPIYGLTRPCKT